MTSNFFFLPLSIFLIIYFIFKNKNFLKDNIKYSSHKILGSENKSPIILGGLYILITILVFYPITSVYFNITLILITSLGLLSDKNILPSPKMRLLAQLIILLLFVYLENLEVNDLRYDKLNILLSNDFFNLFFTVFCLAILLNGSNFLDGLNGLISGYYLVVLIALLILENLYGNTLSIDIKFLYLIFFVLIIFFIFNIFGLVYLGDSGSYAVALLIGSYLIKFNLSNDLISPYYIAVILWYPAFENLFSLLRRFFRKEAVSNADNYHLHQLFFLFLKSKKIFSNKIRNSLTSLIILLINIPGLIIANFYATKSPVLIFILLSNILLYLLFYYVFFQNVVVKK